MQIPEQNLRIRLGMVTDGQGSPIITQSEPRTALYQKLAANSIALLSQFLTKPTILANGD